MASPPPLSVTRKPEQGEEHARSSAPSPVTVTTSSVGVTVDVVVSVSLLQEVLNQAAPAKSRRKAEMEMTFFIIDEVRKEVSNVSDPN